MHISVTKKPPTYKKGDILGVVYFHSTASPALISGKFKLLKGNGYTWYLDLYSILQGRPFS